jgi:heptosyltransferase-2
MTQINAKTRVAIILASGIGNSVLFTPTLFELRSRFSHCTIDLIVLKQEFADCLVNTGLVNNVFLIPGSVTGLVKFFAHNFRKYDVSITAFPSNKWQFNLFAFCLGSRVRITHSYMTSTFRSLAFLQNAKVPANPALHDVIQNLSLLKLLGIDEIPLYPRLIYGLATTDLQVARDYLVSRGVGAGDHIVGVHSGAGPLGEKKKWGVENFAREINQYLGSHKAHFVILFGSEAETGERQELSRLLTTSNKLIFNGTLSVTAALISLCHYFLSNDTGLMHIAAAFGIRQKAIFLTTNPTRTRPYNDNAEIEILGDCSRYLYPFWSTSTEETHEPQC